MPLEFLKYFAIHMARTPGEVERIQHLRWLVYCREFQYEREEDCPGERECDVFDPRATHLYAEHIPSGTIAGCVRVVCADSLGPGEFLPLELAYDSHVKKPDLGKIPRETLFEISRLAVSPQFRRRAGERLSPLGLETTKPPTSEIELRTFPLVSLALYLSVIALGEIYALDEAHACAMMQPRLARMLTRFGIVFRQEAPLIDYHGSRAAYSITLQDAVRGMTGDMKSLYTKLCDNLAAQLSLDIERTNSVCTRT
ncbi:hypothetical protein BI364_05180 [Acidihalobacter yilgarnensis]|uniref:GNAT family N-acetyltransferase n=1 Tax=Acidihalobacter yilgarnensis TaxID=2819280 RepID=A0A1D8ILX6_9GAMM|nr:PEP-CTERM/exosortase system-associated acyltransferase [Acidihalobacter yilgarnensis]AOU97450.1 hypothetical protein BI364_05180 [Acidihalobacter yilgarnensis]